MYICSQLKILITMGKGDMKTKRGKITRGTYGKTRPKKKKKEKAQKA